MMRIVIFMKNKQKFVVEVNSQKKIDEFFIALNDELKFVKLGQLILAKSEVHHVEIMTLARP